MTNSIRTAWESPKLEQLDMTQTAQGKFVDGDEDDNPFNGTPAAPS